MNIDSLLEGFLCNKEIKIKSLVLVNSLIVMEILGNMLT